MKRLMALPIVLAALHLSGCVAITAASAVPGVLFESLGFQVSREVETFPRNIEPTAAAAQKSLQEMMLYANVLEIQNKGYSIGFGIRDLSGLITLQEKTPRLTTIRVKVLGKLRDPSVERAIIDSIRSNLAGMDSNQRFLLVDYGTLSSRPLAKAESLGWYRLDADIKTHRHGNSGWLRVNLPSGRNAYFWKNSELR